MSWFTVLHTLLLAAALPAAGFIILTLWGRHIGRQGSASGWLATGLSACTFALAVLALVLWATTLSLNRSRQDYVEAFSYRWLTLPALQPHVPNAPPFSMDSLSTPVAPAPESIAPAARPGPAFTGGWLIDSLTVSAVVLVSLISLLVHLFALGPLSADRRQPRFFGLLQFMSFALLAFLLSNSLLESLVFWEFLGLAAFLLVGFDNEHSPLAAAGSPARAALYMFLLNCAGDAAFILGIATLLLHTRSPASLAFFDAQGTSLLSESVRQTLGVRSSEFLYFTGEGFLQLHWLTWTGIAFLVAALARMAQFPFQAWAHHAAAAPLPVSALLQGAVSLVTGMYLLARVYPIFTIDARFIAAVIGCVTLFTAALVALVQLDLRQVLAWSTVSQGGFMLLFLGAGGYTAAILHLFTHAFFKTALLLAGGTILQGLSPPPPSGSPPAAAADLRQLGGLWKRFPLTAALSLIAALALAGAPWLSGAYSVNLGLACVYDYAHALQGSPGGGGLFASSGNSALLLFYLPALTTYLTALAIGRWWWLIFAGSPRNPKLLEKAHEYAFLTFPVIILAGFSVGFWFDFFGILPLIAKSLPPTLVGLVIDKSNLEADAGYAAALRYAAWSSLGFAAAAIVYLGGFAISNRLRRLPVLNFLEFWLRQRMFFDALYQGILVPVFWLLVQITGFAERILAILLKMLAGLISLLIFIIAQLESPRPATAPPPPPLSSPEVADPAAT